MALPSYPLLGRVALATLAISVPTVLDGVRGVVSARTCDARLDRWSRRLLRQAGVTLDVRGKERIDPARTYVIMSNHQSYYDIPVLFQALGLPMRMVAKEELFRIPVWGRAMRDAASSPWIAARDARRSTASSRPASASSRTAPTSGSRRRGPAARTGACSPSSAGASSSRQ
jgi:1-acyl-sn-glycerol-3-phosphate acyltransferase